MEVPVPVQAGEVEGEDAQTERGQKRAVEDEAVTGENGGEEWKRKKRGKRKKPSYSEPKNALIQLNELKPHGLQWTLLGQQGAVHEPTFYMQVEMDGSQFTGSGKSKKLAKLSCAQNAIQSLVYSAEGQNAAPTQTVITEDLTGPSRNPVQLLNELRPCLAYTVLSETGDTQSKTFTLQTTVTNLEGEEETFQGVGRNKRLAKSRTAQAALLKMFNVEFPASSDDDVLPLYTGDDSAWRKYKPQVAMTLYDNEKNPAQEIHELYKKEAEFEFNHIQLTPAPLVKCTVEIEGQNHEGTGISKKQAKLAACINALQYIKDIGVYEEKRAQLLEKAEEKKKKKEEIMEQWKEKVKLAKEEREKNKPEAETIKPPRPISLLNLFYQNNKKAKFNLISTEKKAWKMSVMIDGKLFIGTGNNDQLAKRAAAREVLNYQVQTGVIEQDISAILEADRLRQEMETDRLRQEIDIKLEKTDSSINQEDNNESLHTLHEQSDPATQIKVEVKQEKE